MSGYAGNSCIDTRQFIVSELMQYAIKNGLDVDQLIKDAAKLEEYIIKGVQSSPKKECQCS